jgi:mono/diheme cytochrome c family protein
VVNGKGVGMPPFGTMFTDTQLSALVAYVRSLNPGKGGASR